MIVLIVHYICMINKYAMATNKHAIIRYRVIDKCLRQVDQTWNWKSLAEACVKELKAVTDTKTTLSERTIKGDLQNIVQAWQSPKWRNLSHHTDWDSIGRRWAELNIPSVMHDRTHQNLPDDERELLTDIMGL